MTCKIQYGGTTTRSISVSIILQGQRIPNDRYHDFVQQLSTILEKSKEKTASSVSGIHFGHYKSVTNITILCNLHEGLLHLVFNFGAPLQRWSKGMSCMLEKKEVSIRVNKLRSILLIEDDFNFGTKILFGKQLMDRMEIVKTIPPEQFCSR